MVEHVAELWGVGREGLEDLVNKRVMVARGERMVIWNNLERMGWCRDAIARNLYQRVWTWIVDELNVAISGGDGGGDKYGKGYTVDIGVLDIFGFECFKRNGFEQLCINFTNERLQGQFNKFVFEEEQELYKQEGITWTDVEWIDNDDCIAVISGPTGVLRTLDDECRLPKGTDSKFVQRLHKQFADDGKGIITADKKQRASGCFVIRHFAGGVEYEGGTGWVEKNKDEVPEGLADVMKESKGLLGEIWKRIKGAEEEKGGKKKRGTVGSKFKDSLNELMDLIMSTDPHYIRCLKPNDDSVPGHFVENRVLEQLRYGGVLEAVRVARMGFPVRMKREEFEVRYKAIFGSGAWEGVVEATRGSGGIRTLQDMEGTRRGRIHQLLLGEANHPLESLNPEGVQMGKSMVFLKSNDHSTLESSRSLVLRATAILLQSFFRSSVVRRVYKRHLQAARLCQRYWRGHRGRAKARGVREGKMGAVLVRVLRGRAKRRSYTRLRSAVWTLQVLRRRRVERKATAAVDIQKLWRGWYHQGRFWGFVKCMVALQSILRCKLARRALRELKSDAKNVHKMAEEVERGKGEILALKRMLKEREKGRRRVEEGHHRRDSLEDEVKVWKEKAEKLERDAVALRVKNQKRTQGEVSRLKNELREETRRRVKAEAELVKFRAKVEGIDIGDIDVEGSLTFDDTDDETEPDYDSLEEGGGDGGENGVLRSPKARGPGRGEMKRRSSMEIGSRIRDNIYLNSRKLIEDSAHAINKAGSEDWGRRWDEDGGEREGDSRMEKVLRMRCVGDDNDNDNDNDGPRVLLDNSAASKALASPSSLVSFAPSPSPFNLFSQRKDSGTILRKRNVDVGEYWRINNKMVKWMVLRDELRRFELTQGAFVSNFTSGFPCSMWVATREDDEEEDEHEDWIVKGVAVEVKLSGMGAEEEDNNNFLASSITFTTKPGYLRRSSVFGALTGKTGGDKVINDIPFHEVVDVRAGVMGEEGEIPGSKAGKVVDSVSSSHLFLTVLTVATPLHPPRSVLLRFKSRQERNDVLGGLRMMMAEGWVRENMEGKQPQHSTSPNYSIFKKKGGGFDTPKSATKVYGSGGEHGAKTMVLLEDVNTQLSKERSNYERLMIQLLQSSFDLAGKEEELAKLKKKLTESEKGIGRVDDKVLMQLSKKLETLLIDNEDLREQNERLLTEEMG